MKKYEYDELQISLSNLLEKHDVSGRKIRRSQDYKDAVFAAKSVLHNYFEFHNEDDKRQILSSSGDFADNPTLNYAT